MLIGLTGTPIAGSGKDTVADLLVEEFGFVKVAFADPFKRYLMDAMGFTERQLWGESAERAKVDVRYGITPRHALQTMGTEVGRLIYEDIWVNYAVRVAEKLMYGQTHKTHEKFNYHRTRGLYPWNESPQEDIMGIVFPDVRHENEAVAITAAGAAIWNIVRPVPGLQGKAGEHSSERGLDPKYISRTLDNSGDKESLFRAVRSAMSETP